MHKIESGLEFFFTESCRRILYSCINTFLSQGPLSKISSFIRGKVRSQRFNILFIYIIVDLPDFAYVKADVIIYYLCSSSNIVGKLTWISEFAWEKFSQPHGFIQIELQFNANHNSSILGIDNYCLYDINKLKQKIPTLSLKLVHICNMHHACYIGITWTSERLSENICQLIITIHKRGSNFSGKDLSLDVLNWKSFR